MLLFNQCVTLVPAKAELLVARSPEASSVPSESDKSIRLSRKARYLNFYGGRVVPVAHIV